MGSRLRAHSPQDGALRRDQDDRVESTNVFAQACWRIARTLRIDKLADRRYIGSVIVAESNSHGRLGGRCRSSKVRICISAASTLTP